MQFVGIEQCEEYFNIATKRIEFICKQQQPISKDIIIEDLEDKLEVEFN